MKWFNLSTNLVQIKVKSLESIIIKIKKNYKANKFSLDNLLIDTEGNHVIKDRLKKLATFFMKHIMSLNKRNVQRQEGFSGCALLVLCTPCVVAIIRLYVHLFNRI